MGNTFKVKDRVAGSGAGMYDVGEIVAITLKDITVKWDYDNQDTYTHAFAEDNLTLLRPKPAGNVNENRIAKYCISIAEDIKDQFYPKLTNKEVAVTYDPNNWEYEEDYDDEDVYLYNCEPLDDQLRAYVYNDGRLEVLGE